jgi:GTP-binding protein Era
MHSDIKAIHKSGFVNIVGNSNVGKSTLMNVLIGEKLSIITYKAQTTRHRIIGIVNTTEMQIVYSDTPGVLHPNYKLQKKMLNFSESALEDADVLLYVTDILEDAWKNVFFLKKIQKLTLPILLVINKIDLSNQNQLEQKVLEWKKILPYAEIIPLSATNRFNIDYLKKKIEKLLPVAPPFFKKNTLTDRSSRFFVTEIVREKILLYYKKEIPYSVEVVVEFFKDFVSFIEMNITIFTEKESQKKIIIGNNGNALNKICFIAQKDIEKFLDKRIMLKMYVKVKKKWRNRNKFLKQFGY